MNFEENNNCKAKWNNCISVPLSRQNKSLLMTLIKGSLIVIMPFLTSCSKNDDIKTENLLTLGPWKYTQTENRYYTGERLDSTKFSIEADRKGILTFKNDYSVLYQGEWISNKTINGIWKVNASNKVLNTDLHLDLNPVTGYTSYPLYTECEIIQLSRSNLTLVINNSIFPQNNRERKVIILEYFVH